jgi:hypothetical protein
LNSKYARLNRTVFKLPIINPMMVSLHIIFRSCAVVKTLSKTSDRPFGLDKSTMILKSLKSLLNSAMPFKSGKVSIDVIDDSSGDAFVTKMQKLLIASKISHKIHRLNVRSNGQSLKACYDLASKSKSDIIYFVEDDYMHLPKEVPAVMAAYAGKILGHSQFCVHPTDYPDRYVKLYPSYLFISPNCHWRSIASTTGTFYITNKLFAKHKDKLYKFAELNEQKIGGGEEKTLNRMFDTDPCISPIPSLAAHLNDDTLPPLIDWKSEINKIQI